MKIGKKRKETRMKKETGMKIRKEKEEGNGNKNWKEKEEGSGNENWKEREANRFRQSEQEKASSMAFVYLHYKDCHLKRRICQLLVHPWLLWQ